MTISGFSKTALLALVGATALSIGSGTAQAAPDPHSTTASAPCDTGPGAMAVSVVPGTEDGSFDIVVTATQVVEGSTWRLRIGWEEEDEVRARRTAVDGTWTVARTITDVQSEQPNFFAYASGRHGDRGFSCITGVVLGNPSAGIGSCGNGLDGILLRRRADGTYVVTGVVLAVAPERTRWHIELRIKGTNETTTVAFDDYSNRYAELVNRTTFTDLPNDPRLTMKATSAANRTTCRVSLDPPQLTGTPASAGRTPRQFLRALR